MLAHSLIKTIFELSEGTSRDVEHEDHLDQRTSGVGLETSGEGLWMNEFGERYPVRLPGHRSFRAQLAIEPRAVDKRW